MPENDKSQPIPDQERRFMIQRIYTSDISFEIPNHPQTFAGMRWTPDIDVRLSNKGEKIRNNVHEVTLTVTVTAKLEDKTAYLVEVQQTGVFKLENIGDEELAAIIGSACPTILFPYARELISNLITRGGFPHLILNPVNFDALYMEHLKETREKEQQQEHSTTH